jgi:hypothetical protein
VLAAQIQQVVRGLVHDASPAGQHVELGLEVDEVGADPPAQARQTFSEIDRAARTADGGELVQGAARSGWYRERHEAASRMRQDVSKILEISGARNHSRQLPDTKALQ